MIRIIGHKSPTVVGYPLSVRLLNIIIYNNNYCSSSYDYNIGYIFFK